MDMQIVWFEGMKISRWSEFVRCSHAMANHYGRIMFGPQFGMSGRSA